MTKIAEPRNIKPGDIFPAIAEKQRAEIDRALFGEMVWNRFIQNSAAGAQTSISFGGLTFRPGEQWEIFEVSLVAISEYTAGGAFRSVPCRLSLTATGVSINTQLDNAVDALSPAFDDDTHFLAFEGDGNPKATTIIVPPNTTITIQGRAYDNYVLSDVASFYVNIRYRVNRR